MGARPFVDLADHSFQESEAAMPVVPSRRSTARGRVRRAWSGRAGDCISPLLIALALMAVPGTTEAQSGVQSGVLRVQEGDSLRVHLEGNLPITAAFHAWDGEYMMLGIEGIDDEWPVSIFEMNALELYTLRTSQESFRHGAILGAVSGIFIGAAVGLALHSLGVTDDPDAPPAQLMTNALRGAGLGFALGGIGGGLYFGKNPGWGWVSITLPGG